MERVQVMLPTEMVGFLSNNIVFHGVSLSEAIRQCIRDKMTVSQKSLQVVEKPPKPPTAREQKEREETLKKLGRARDLQGYTNKDMQGRFYTWEREVAYKRFRSEPSHVEAELMLRRQWAYEKAGFPVPPLDEDQINFWVREFTNEQAQTEAWLEQQERMHNHENH